MLEKATEWLSNHAPKIVEALQEPASTDKIKELETLVGKNLPESFFTLYQTYNGINPDMFANFAYGMPFISIEQTISQITEFELPNDKTNLNYADDGIKVGYSFGKLRVPIGDDSGTCLICVDLDPDINGTYGQVILIDYDHNIALKLADSVENYIETFTSDLLSGRYSLQEDALEDGVHWLQPEKEIDPGNWFSSPTWQYVPGHNCS
ncbi:SMI1/KNR4 family protein [Paraglaciecola chathamensis]|jgi:cell wall assembly regulator SMI1|nr:SMI1/KNR4 family protein [Paraglaciecola agarilytica]